MGSLFYSSNQKRERKYVKENVKREVNQYNQQEIVDDSIAEELGLQQESNRLSKLASRVIGRLGAESHSSIKSYGITSITNDSNRIFKKFY